MSGLLSATEKARAARFRFAKDRDFFMIRHGILRLILSKYLERAPRDIEFDYGPKGKPELHDSPVRLHFNDSHSEELALYAVTRACPIGVDIERIRPIPDFEKIAARYFSSREAAIMRALPPEQRTEAFYACWTRKEAYLKATGEGIGRNLGKIEVTVEPEKQAEILRTPEESAPAAEWKLRSFSPVPEYIGAIAFQGRITSVCQWQVPSNI